MLNLKTASGIAYMIPEKVIALKDYFYLVVTIDLDDI